MDDTRSMLSSIYWDTRSIGSEATWQNQSFHTPTGSFMDLSIYQVSKYDSDSESRSSSRLTPEISVIQLAHEYREQQEETESEMAEESEALQMREEPVSYDCRKEQVRPCSVIPARPPPIKLQKSQSVDIESVPPKSPEKKDWRRSFAKRVSFTKTRIMKSLSINKHESRSQNGSHRSVLLSMRNSIRRLRSYDKHKSSAAANERKEPETIKDTLGSDCDYFNFEKCSIRKNSDVVNEVFEGGTENTPIKPRRQFSQDKYLTGSEDMLQKAYNSLNRKSQIEEDKSIFDLCSTLLYLLESDYVWSSSSYVPKHVPKYIDDCLDAFLEMNTKQIESGLQLVNRNMAYHFDLFSESLDVIDQTKKYRVEELLGSNGVCVITDVETRQRYVALKRTDPRNWVSFTGFLQHIEKDSEPFANQTWICYPADSITNMYLERDCFEPRFENSKLILDSLLQLLVLLHSQIKADGNRDDIKPANVLLISSNLSLVCVFDKSELWPEKDQSALSAININGDEAMRRTYQQSLMNINAIVTEFFTHSANSHHLISASYPLDYLFFIALKLHKDINVLLQKI